MTVVDLSDAAFGHRATIRVRVVNAPKGKTFAAAKTVIVFGRAEGAREPRPSGHQFVSVSTDAHISRSWFSVERVTVHDEAGNRRGSLLLLCCHDEMPVEVWQSGEPDVVWEGQSLILSPTDAFIGGYEDAGRSTLVGARVSLTDTAIDNLSFYLPGAAATTLEYAPLELTAEEVNALTARYHGYYRLPPHFNPRPLGYTEIAHMLNRDPAQVGRTLNKFKKRLDSSFPGWLGPKGPTEKTFHDRVRNVLEASRVNPFHPARLAAFDKVFDPLKLRTAHS